MKSIKSNTDLGIFKLLEEKFGYYVKIKLSYYRIPFLYPVFWDNMNMKFYKKFNSE